MRRTGGVSGDELRAAALAHVARFAASEAGLLRVLGRRIARWSARALQAGEDPDSIQTEQRQARLRATAIVAELVHLGAIDNAAFAQSRARSLTRGGRSRRAIAAHLAGRGIEPDQIEDAMVTIYQEAGDQEAGSEATQLAAALVHARRRRLGPFRAIDPELPALEQAAARQRGLAALARAGFAHDVAATALDTDRDTAEQMITRLRLL